MIIKVEDLGKGILKDEHGVIYYVDGEEITNCNNSFRIAEYDEFDNVIKIETI